MNLSYRFFHSWFCQDCEQVGCTEVHNMISELPDEITCDHCGSSSVTKLSNHQSEPSIQLLERIRDDRVRSIEKDNQSSKENTMTFEEITESSILEALENESEWVTIECMQFKLSKLSNLEVTTTFFITIIGKMVEKGKLESLLVKTANKEDGIIHTFIYRKKQ